MDMEIPDNIKNIIQLLMASEKRWKAQYMATWHYAYYLEAAYKNTPYWDKKLELGLPASKQKFYSFTPNELNDIVRSKDGEFTLGHLQTLFSLFEELISEVCPVLYPGKSLDASRFGDIRGFLKAEGDFAGLTKFVTDSEFDEVELAKKNKKLFYS
jgi:hypothetical protein